MPILNRDNVVIGVAQIINKKTGTHEFTLKDINVSLISIVFLFNQRNIFFRSSVII
jgi:hypothetical protein